MTIPGVCKVCESRDVSQIDARLASGESLRAIGRDTGSSAATLSRHWNGCRHRGAAPKRAGPPPPLDPAILAPLPLPVLPPDDPRASSLAELQRVHAIAQDAYKRAHDAEDNRAIALLVPQLRMNVVKAIEIAMKGRREEQPPAERLMSNPEFAAASRVLFDVLDRHPDAKADVIAALEAWIGGDE